MKRWEYPEPRLLRAGSLGEALEVFPREEDFTVTTLRALWRAGLSSWLLVWHRVSYEGKESLLPEEPFVLCANHSSHLDALVLSNALPLRRINHVYVAAARDYFFSSIARALFSFVALNALAFDRKKNPHAALARAESALSVGRGVLIIFPEGTRSPDGALHPFRPGIGKILLDQGVAAVPAWIEGASRAMPKGALVPRPRRITVRFGPPMRFSGVPNDRTGWERVAAAVEDEVRRLGGLPRRAGPPPEEPARGAPRPS